MLVQGKGAGTSELGRGIHEGSVDGSSSCCRQMGTQCGGLGWGNS